MRTSLQAPILRHRSLTAGITAAVFAFITINAMAAAPNGFQSHQRYISALESKPAFDINDPASVLKFVLTQSEYLIAVQPTENYSYFKFVHGGLQWQGNMRLETESKTADRLHFAYFVVPAPWHEEELGQYKAFGKDDGVEIARLGAYKYVVRYAALERIFQLNDISKTKIKPKMLGPDQVDLGLAHDESGLRFHLLFDTNVKDFTYVLDEENGVADQFRSLSNEGDDLLVGIRTGFVFKSEPELFRKRLVGVHSYNIETNNYYDGPFDQLPDGYTGKLNIRQAFELIDPEFAKTIDAYGNFVDREGARVVIAPYLRYQDKSEFTELEDCALFRATSVDYRMCIKKFLER